MGILLTITPPLYSSYSSMLITFVELRLYGNAAGIWNRPWPITTVKFEVQQ